MTTPIPSANDVLMGGGPKVPAIRFADPGTTATGRITAPPVAYQERDYDPNNPGGGNPKYYPSGDPIMAIYVDVATSLRDPSIEDDDGTRRIFIEGRWLKEAVRESVRAAGAGGLEVGGSLTLQFTHREDPMDKRSRKYWAAQYTPAGNAALMAAPAPQPAAAPTPAPQAPVATQQAPQTAAAPTVAAPQETPAVKAKQLAALGISHDIIAAQLGVDIAIVPALLA